MTKIRYTINKINFIRQALSGYARTDAIVSELVQNADDARANSVTFYFRKDVLEVHNNSHFTEQDFLNITDIASGGKRSELEKTGTWGTGFLAVFHVTDYPELMSSGRHLIFNPELDELEEQTTAVVDKTVFRLPWRRTRTDLAAKLEARTWTDEEIQRLRATMSETVYRLILFLRHVNTIDVFLGDIGKETLLIRVHRQVETSEHTIFGMRQRWKIEYKDSHQTRSDAWLCYRKYISDSELPQNVIVKDQRAELAFPIKQTEWLRDRLAGRLYNFLPTPIETNLPFQINGSFFPDNNRNSILLDEHTQREKAHWNQTVIRTLAGLFSDSNVIQDIRDQVDDSTRFYNLLPFEEPKQDYLRPIRQRFVEAARNLPIVYHSLGGWAKPSDVYIGVPGSQLPQLVAEYIPIVPDGTPQVFRDFLAKELRTPKLDWKVTARYLLAQGLAPGTRLADAHKMVNKREKLEKLYFDLSRRTKEEDDRELLTKLPICLDQNQVLWRFSGDNIRWVDTKLRKILNNNKLRLVDSEIQNRYETLIKEFLLEFRGSQLVESLAAETWPARPCSISALSNKLIHSFDQLAELLRFIHSDLNNVDANLLAKIPIVRTEADQLWCADDQSSYFVKQSIAIKLAKELGLTVVNVNWGKDEAISAVYRKAKGQNTRVQDLRPDDIIGQLYKVPEKLQERSLTEQIDFLSKLYKYLLDEELSPTSKLRLRAASICLTSQGKLQPTRNDKTILNLPTDTTIQSDALKHLDHLQLDHLVHSELLKDHDNRRFFAQILEVKPLSSEELIQNVIVKSYGDPRLDDTVRFDLLNFIREQIQLAGQSQPALLNALRGARLIYCKDGQYRRAEDVYFASSDLDKLFPDGYPQLYPGYLAQSARSGEVDQRTLQDTPWGLFLRTLGINEYPRPAHVVDAIRKIVEFTSPTDERREQLRPLYQLLRDSVGNRYQTNDPDLLKLREIAWLPASNFSHSWFKPSEIFPPSKSDIVGKRASILAFSEPTTELRELLKIPLDPPVQVVFEHLQDCIQRNSEPKYAIYVFLANHPTQEHIKVLQTCRSIWAQGRFWRPKQVFFHSSQIAANLFRHRRGYFESNLPSDVRNFFEKLGVRDQPHPWEDSLSLLLEIAEEYQIEPTLSKEDINLLSAHTEWIGHELQGANNKLLIERLREFTSVVLVPDKNHRLYHPNRIVIPDQPDLLKKFDTNQIPVVDEQFLTPAKLLFFQQLGIVELSQAVKREIASNDNLREDQRFELDLQQRVRAFDRIAAKTKESKILPSERLKTIKVRICNPIRVRYRFDNGHDWRLTGTTEEEPALYDEKLNFLYIKDTDPSRSAIALAKELERVFFPGQKESPVIEQILQKKHTEIDVYLNNHGYPKLYESSQSEPVDEFIPDLPLWQFSDQVTSTEPAAPNNGHTEVTKPLLSSSSQSSQQPALFFPASPNSQPPTDLSNRQENHGSSRNESATVNGGSITPVTTKPQTPFIAQRTVDSGKSASNNQLLEGQTKSPEITSHSPYKSKQVDEIPIFTGLRRPAVPILPNNYGELTKKFGLTRNGTTDVPQAQTEIAGEDQVTSDVDWKQSSIPNTPLNSEDTNHNQVTVTRFTLTYANRYEGFLPLYNRVRTMLDDCPQRIRCQTDFDGWEFELYADYREDILHNQEQLPAFLSAFEIPAGGIIYLERVHDDNFRLYWKRAESQLENVRCLELLEDGTLEEYLIPVSTFRCEVSEYVLRAEKRLEDAKALFAQALDKRGIFQTICEVFGAPGKELRYDNIYQGVMLNRMVAKASIDYQLQQRPCFVNVSNDLWRFEPQQGSEPLHQQSDDKETSIFPNTYPQQPGPYISKPVFGQTPTKSAPPTPYHRLAQYLQQEWSKLTDQICTDEIGFDGLLRVSQILSDLQKRLAADLNALQSQSSQRDDLLVELWFKFIATPESRQAQEDMYRYLSSVQENSMEIIVSQIQRHLAETEYNLREIYLFPILKRVADESIEKGKIEWAKQLYLLLQEQGAGDFAQALQQLEKADELQQVISRIQSNNPEQRLALSVEFWKSYDGNLQLRTAIREIFEKDIPVLRKKIEQLLANGEVQVAWENYKSALDKIRDLEKVWDQNHISKTLWTLGQRIFEQLILSAKKSNQPLSHWRNAINLVSYVPDSQLVHFITEDYLRAAITVAENYANQNDTIAAIAILEYNCFIIRNSKQQVDKQMWVDAYKKLSEYYASLKLYHAAYNRMNEAKRKTPPTQKSHFDGRIQELFNQRADMDNSLAENWKLRTMELLQREDFHMLVNPSYFEEGFVKLLRKLDPEQNSSY